MLRPLYCRIEVKADFALMQHLAQQIVITPHLNSTKVMKWQINLYIDKEKIRVIDGFVVDSSMSKLVIKTLKNKKRANILYIN